MKKVLIVENEMRIRMAYANLLLMSGFQVVRASSAWEAASIVIDETVDLILLDIHMPETDGREFFDMVKEYNPHIKVMICSVEPIENQKTLIPQAVEYFDKSQGPKALLEKINSILL